MLLAVIAVAAMAAGLGQNIAQTYVAWVGWDLVDDGLVVLLCVLASLRFRRGQWVRVALAALWAVALLGALLHTWLDAVVPLGDALVLLRQVALPAALVFAGSFFARREWLVVARAAMWIGVLNGVYMLLEVFNVHLIDPNVLAARDGLYIFPEGLPGHYFVWAGGETYLRSGGLYLNPPTAGLVTAFAAVAAFHVLGSRWRYALCAFLACMTVASFSRAGLLILAAGLLVPVLLRLLGVVPALVLSAVAAGGAAWYFLSSDGTAIHFDGAVAGVRDALSHPLGRGFGYAGNFSVHLPLSESSESLAGIAFSAGGLVCLGVFVGICLWLAVYALRDMRWEPALALGVLIAALFAETAGSMNATVPMWIGVGVALAMARQQMFAKAWWAPFKAQLWPSRQRARQAVTAEPPDAHRLPA